MPTAALALARSWKAFDPQRLLQSSLASCKAALLHRIVVIPPVRIAVCRSAAPAAVEREQEQQQQSLQNRAGRNFCGVLLYRGFSSSAAAPNRKRISAWRGAGCGDSFYDCFRQLPSSISFFEVGGHNFSSRSSSCRSPMDLGIGERMHLEMSEKKEGDAASGEEEEEEAEDEKKERVDSKVRELQQQKEQEEQLEKVKKEEEEKEKERKRKAEKEREIEEKIGPPPEKPLAGDCCEQGCVVCVWDTYGEELDEYEKLRKAAEEELSGK